MKSSDFVLGAVLTFGLMQAPAHAQVIGSYDNFDCFDDTGEDAEGFEIDVEDVSSSDLIREFPSNFSSSPWVIRYGLPTVTAYDWTAYKTPASVPDQQHSYDAGHKGVLVTWAATWSGKQWVAAYGKQPFGAGLAGNATKYVANPTYTNGDSCWYYGLGAKYPTSGCDHFGISFAAGVAPGPGAIKYHWKIPNPNIAGALMNWTAEASIPPSPSLAPVAGQPGVVQAVAEAGDNENQIYWGSAYFVKVTTLYSPSPVNLDALQKGVVKNAKTRKIVNYSVLQRPPANGAGEVEKEDVADDRVPAHNVQVTKQYEYFAFGGDYDSETGQAVCDAAYGNQADALDGSNQIQSGDSCTLPGSYWVIDSYTDLPVFVKTNKGKYLGAHINAFGPAAAM